jgi:hypothetical protein
MMRNVDAMVAATIQSGMTQPGMMQPGMMQPGMMQPGMTQPGMMQPGMMQPGMMQPGMTQPGMMQPQIMQPGGLSSPVFTAMPGSACGNNCGRPAHSSCQQCRNALCSVCDSQVYPCSFIHLCMTLSINLF